LATACDDGGGAGRSEGTTAVMMNEVRAELFLRRLPPEVRSSLDPKQEEAIRSAAGGRSAASHPVDIRLSLPLPWGRFYLAIAGGQERRNPARRARDRRLRPLTTTGNSLFFGILVGSFCLLLLSALLFYDAIASVIVGG